MLKYIQSYFSQSLASDKVTNMSPVAPSNLSSSANDIKYECVVPLCDIFAGSIRKRKNAPNEAVDEKSSSDEENEAPQAVKKRIVKILSDEEDDKDDSDYQKDDSDYELKKVIPKKKEMVFGYKKRKAKNVKVSEKKSKGLNSYEKMIEEKRAERIQILKSMGIDQIKEDISTAIGGIKQIRKSSRSYKKHSPPSLEPIRRSRRLANLDVDLSEKAQQKLALKNSFGEPVYDPPIPPELTFEASLKSASPYEECIKDLSVQESGSKQGSTFYRKKVLDNMSLNDFNVCKVVPARITSAAWYPSNEDLVVAAGDKFGNLGLWKIQDSETTPHLFKVHKSNIPNMQFCLFNPSQLITCSYDGTLRCGDLVKHTFNEIYKTENFRATWFDFLSPTTYLISHSNGEVAVLDRRTEGKTSEKRHVCHDFTIKTVSVHPMDKNMFVTCDNKKTIRLWDLRRLRKNPIVEMLHHSRTVNSAYFSPVTGNSILSTSLDDSICIFDSANLTPDIRLKAKMKHNNFTGRWLTIFRATWLPNSDDLFSVGFMGLPRAIQLFDKDLNRYHDIIDDNLTTVTSVHRFHPCRSALAGGNSSGKLFVFT